MNLMSWPLEDLPGIRQCVVGMCKHGCNAAGSTIACIQGSTNGTEDKEIKQVCLTSRF